MPEVTIYTRPTCGPCRTAKQFLKIKGAKYTEKNVDDPENMAEYARLAPVLQVPLIVVGDRVISGLNLSLLSKALML